MQNLMGRIRRCAEDYNMICAGDKIAVGVSGCAAAVLSRPV